MTQNQWRDCSNGKISRPENTRTREYTQQHIKEIVYNVAEEVIGKKTTDYEEYHKVNKEIKT